MEAGGEPVMRRRLRPPHRAVNASPRFSGVGTTGEDKESRGRSSSAFLVTAGQRLGSSLPRGATSYKSRRPSCVRHVTHLLGSFHRR
ncbi:hypothetical protein V5799_006820 [Amblyomma americanum]|uniref:Uncharacterized protein n=1 Tax=Amblyomma americanum TaxID=6943 RepID=A0AAQ4DVA8_AMBAM